MNSLTALLCVRCWPAVIHFAIARLFRPEQSDLQGTADNPKVRVCRLPDIKRKLDNRKFTAPDANGNSISVADIVTIKDGGFAGRSGTVKFVVRGSVFIQSRQDLLANAGPLVKIPASMVLRL